MKWIALQALGILLASCALGQISDQDASSDAPADGMDSADLADGAADDIFVDIECPTGLTNCGGECVHTDSNHSHCGACGNECDPAQVCNEGSCAMECPDGKVACSGACVDVTTDIFNCGGCGTVCTAGDHAEPVCELGLCSVICEAGWSDEDGNGSCETNCVPTSTTEICNGIDDNCNGSVDEDFDCRMGREVACTTICESTGRGICGVDCEIPPPASCNPPEELCNGEDDDCDGQEDNGFDCTPGETASCTTSCGSMGTAVCTASCDLGPCDPPSEACNGSDDDCDGNPDNTSGCTIPVYRFLCGSDHLYKNNSSVPGGCNPEGGGNPVWYMYATEVSGSSFSTTELFRLASSNDHFYTVSESERDYAISIGYSLEGNIGYCSRSEVSGMTTPLYRLLNSSNGDHFYTTSSAERDNAISSHGYVSEGTACHVFTE